MKLSKWNTPLKVPLDPNYKTIVGRVAPASSTDKTRYVCLNSEKLPFMLSTRHASLVFGSAQKKWLIEDLGVCGVIVGLELYYRGWGYLT